MSTTVDLDFTDSFKAWLEGNVGELYRYAFYLCRDRRLAEDIAHDACVNIFKSPRRVLKFKSYALSCVHRAYLDHWRAPGHRNGSRECALPADEGHRVYRVGDRSMEIITSIDLRDAMSWLPEEDRELIFLRYYLGYGIAEAVEAATGVTGAAAYPRHQGALDALRVLLITGRRRRV